MLSGWESGDELREGCVALRKATGYSGELGWVLQRVGGVRWGLWPLLGWRGRFGPVHFAEIAEVLGPSLKCFPKANEARH